MTRVFLSVAFVLLIIAGCIGHANRPDPPSVVETFVAELAAPDVIRRAPGWASGVWRVGHSCSAPSESRPMLIERSLPVIGGTFRFLANVRGLRSMAENPDTRDAWLLVGFRDDQWLGNPLPMSIPFTNGCELYLAPALIYALPASADTATTIAVRAAGSDELYGALALPLDDGLVGLELWLQIVVRVTGERVEWLTTNALKIHVGLSGKEMVRRWRHVYPNIPPSPGER